MTRKKRLRRVGILCCHCLRNIAFYKAGWRDGALKLDDQFWINVNSNFLDIAVLEWCKLFADSQGKHFWRKVISDPVTFWHGFLEKLGLHEAGFQEYVKVMRTYRDKFVAHLDTKDTMNIPKLKVSINSTMYLYDYLLAHEEEDDCLSDGPRSASSFYNRFFDHGTSVYEKLMT